jgi:methionine-rich copper-binding protein CopC
MQRNDAMKPIRKYAASVMLAAAAMAGSTSARAHATLLGTTPAKDAEVAAAPGEITLRFNEKLEAAFSNAKLVDGNGNVVSTQKATLDQADPSVMKLAVPALAAGGYKVEYVGVGHDGHRRKGEYSFNVK